MMGNTALIISCINQMQEIALKLLDLDCKPKTMNKHNKTALHYAHKYNMISVMNKLLLLEKCETCNTNA